MLTSVASVTSMIIAGVVAAQAAWWLVLASVSLRRPVLPQPVAGGESILAIVPAFFAFGGTSSLALRFFRILRMLRLAKLGRTSTAWTAIREATVRRFRPIVLTAAAAVLAMIPLTRSVLWGPMAYAIMGGLIVATILTVLFVPALYAAWFRVRRV